LLAKAVASYKEFEVVDWDIFENSFFAASLGGAAPKTEDGWSPKCFALAVRVGWITGKITAAGAAADVSSDEWNVEAPAEAWYSDDATGRITLSTGSARLNTRAGCDAACDEEEVSAFAAFFVGLLFCFETAASSTRGKFLTGAAST
jgi:hypothetical protein